MNSPSPPYESDKLAGGGWAWAEAGRGDALEMDAVTRIVSRSRSVVKWARAPQRRARYRRERSSSKVTDARNLTAGWHDRTEGSSRSDRTWNGDAFAVAFPNAPKSVKSRSSPGHLGRADFRPRKKTGED